MKTLSALTLAMFLGIGTLPAVDWRPVDASELAQKMPRVDPTADAEAIFWDVRLEDKLLGRDFELSLNHYIRIKIFTDLGREKYATVEIPRFGKRTISEVAGRTIKSDGSIIELTKDAIFDRELVKTKALKLRGKTFTLPNVTVGDIIEYRYKETRMNETSSHMRLYFQRELPLWNVTYHLKPISLPWQQFTMRSLAFQCNHPPFQQEPHGFFATSLSDVPAFQAEPYMPPEDSLRKWMLIYYEQDKKMDPERFWRDTGKSDFAFFKPRTNVDALVTRTAAELTSGLTKDEDKLAALDRFCRTKIQNLNSSAFQMTAEERKEVKASHSPADTLKQNGGSSMDVNLLFVALAKAAGFEARMARVSDRGDFFFNKILPTTYFLSNFSAAVKEGDGWVFFDPATPYLEPGMLRWQEEGIQALISDPEEGFFTSTQSSGPARSKRVRRGTFKLLDDGTLEGSVQFIYSGHAGRLQKLRYQNMTPAQQEEDWKASVKSRLNSAEISGFEIKDAGDSEKPVAIKHDISVPGYATRTGKRILFQPAFFEHNVPPRFTGSKRKWDLYFEYGWAEDDEVTIDLPEGWELDQPLAPSSTSLGDVGNYAVDVHKAKDGRSLRYHRVFEWGQKNKLYIPAGSYQNVKASFDFVQGQDGYTIALKAAGNEK